MQQYNIQCHKHDLEDTKYLSFSTSLSRERRESELCDAYRNAATPDEAAVVLQCYALRFTISDATLDSLKLPRYPANPKQDLHPADRERKTTSPTNESSQPPNKLEPPVIKDQSHAEPGEMKTDVTAQQETSVSSSSPAAGGPLGPVTNSENVPPQSLEVNEPRSKPTPTTRPKQPIAGDAKPQPKHSEAAHVPPHSTRPGHALPSPPSVAPRPVPLLAAKPYCQPRSAQSGHKPVKVSEGLISVSRSSRHHLTLTVPPQCATSCFHGRRCLLLSLGYLHIFTSYWLTWMLFLHLSLVLYLFIIMLSVLVCIVNFLMLANLAFKINKYMYLLRRRKEE